MKVIIPVAGYGTRLKPHTDRIQKALLPVAGKPLLDHMVEELIFQGLNRITFIIGYLGDQIIDHMSRFEGEFEFITQQDRLGLGHAVYQGLADSDEPVLVHLGDAVYRYPFGNLEKLTTNGIAVLPVQDPHRFGVVELEGDNIIGFHEKVAEPPTNLAIIGLYYFQSERRIRAALEHLIKNDRRNKGEYQLTDALTQMLEWGDPFVVLPGAQWLDAGVPATYLETNRALLVTSHGEFPGIEFREPVFVGSGCSIEDSVIGPNVTVMDNCRITGCEIDDSIILADSRLENLKLSGKIAADDGSQIC